MDCIRRLLQWTWDYAGWLDHRHQTESALLECWVRNATQCNNTFNSHFVTSNTSCRPSRTLSGKIYWVWIINNQRQCLLLYIDFHDHTVPVYQIAELVVTCLLWLSYTLYSVVQKKMTVLLSISLAWPAWSGWVRAELFSEPGSNFLLNPVHI